MQKTDKKQLNWIVTLLLSVFLGALGMDRFMLGHIFLGILKLVLCLFVVGLIWYVIDIVLIATKHEFEGIEWV